MATIYKIYSDNICGKPRMTRSDAWKDRSCVNKYWAFKDDIVRCLGSNLESIERALDASGTLSCTFYLRIPMSYSKKKAEMLLGTKHTNKPDLDNLVKALLDCICKNDSSVWRFKDVKKIWHTCNMIEITLEE